MFEKLTFDNNVQKKKLDKINDENSFKLSNLNSMKSAVRCIHSTRNDEGVSLPFKNIACNKRSVDLPLKRLDSKIFEVQAYLK
jgi:hypothetical protein